MTIICDYFGSCGGCVHQNMSAEDYRRFKEKQIETAFSFMHIPVHIKTFVTVPAGTRRRACFAFYKGHLGFNKMKSHQIIDIKQCPLLTDQLNRLIPALKPLVVQLRGSGDIFLLDTAWGVDMHIKMGKDAPSLAQLELLATFGNQQNIARLLFNDTPILEKVKLPFPPNVFLQPSEIGEKTLVNFVLDALNGTEKVVDLFCGTGTFTKPIRKKGCSVIGFDSERDSVAALGDMGNERDLFRNPLLPDELNAFDVAVIDPPRAGARAQIEQLATSNIRKIIFISCNPATAARDAKTLIDAGYQMGDLLALDQFTFSNHIEIATVFTK